MRVMCSSTTRVTSIQSREPGDMEEALTRSRSAANHAHHMELESICKDAARLGLKKGKLKLGSRRKNGCGLISYSREREGMAEGIVGPGERGLISKRSFASKEVVFTCQSDLTSPVRIARALVQAFTSEDDLLWSLCTHYQVVPDLADVVVASVQVCWEEEGEPELAPFLVLAQLMFRFNGLRLVQYNKGAEDGFTTAHGSAVHPILAMANHSCDPNCYASFHAGQIRLTSLKPIEAGEQVTISYGPLAGRDRLQDRHLFLQQAYCFDCRCEACLQLQEPSSPKPTLAAMYGPDSPEVSMKK